jgi:preprotein translocase SecE subunit
MTWMSWRIVNWPAFADFLIATEAEMNKVSWTTRKRLVQDTIVVLVTVILLTVFLFVVDILWIRILSNPWVYVLQIDPMKERAKLKEQSQW